MKFILPLFSKIFSEYYLIFFFFFFFFQIEIWRIFDILKLFFLGIVLIFFNLQIYPGRHNKIRHLGSKK